MISLFTSYLEVDFFTLVVFIMCFDIQVVLIETSESIFLFNLVFAFKSQILHLFCFFLNLYACQIEINFMVFLSLALSNSTSIPVSTTTVTQGSHLNVVTSAATENSNSVNITNSPGSDFGNVQPTETYIIGIDFSVFDQLVCMILYSSENICIWRLI